MMKLLCKFYKPSSGAIKFDETLIEDYDVIEYRKIIGAVFQDYAKFDLTVRENTALSDLGKIADDAEILLALKKSGFDETENLEQLLGTQFEDGRDLSGGQWQKIALLRTFFKEAPIVILDEPSSALDTISEKQLFDTFKKNAKDKISIFISHNIKSAQKADKIVVLDNGEVVGVGTHVELLHKCPEYQEIYYSEEYGNV